MNGADQTRKYDLDLMLAVRCLIFSQFLNHPKTIYLGRVNLDVAVQDQAAWRFQTIPCLPPSTGLISLCKAFCESVASFFAQNMEKSIYSPPN